MQIEPNPGLIQQSAAKLRQGKSLDFLRRIEPYQDITLTPKAFFCFFAPLPALEATGSASRVSPDGRKADDRESISRIRLTSSDSGFLGQTCGLPGMTVWRKNQVSYRSFLSSFRSSGLSSD